MFAERPPLDMRDRAKQSQKDEADMAHILSRFRKSGMISHVNRRTGEFVDVSEVGDYRTALENVRKADAFFRGLPAKVRAHFGNDPARFLDEAGSLSKEELVALGVDVLEKRPDAKAAAPEGAAAGGTV